MNPQVVGSAARFGVHYHGAQFQVAWRGKCCRTPCGEGWETDCFKLHGDSTIGSERGLMLQTVVLQMA
jgi:hypothetical protein